jgi:diaminohydroxyphosphoribosylaminopyrimidine deaminase/5-amino-6-(5-phosphoribosylamino)uracil reductase
VSLDGAVADGTGSPGWLTGEIARREVHHLRAGADAVAVGIGTVLADDSLLTVRTVPAPAAPPVRVVFDRRARLPLDSRLVRTIPDAPVVVVTAAATDPHRVARLADAGVTVLEAQTVVDALRQLRVRGVRSVLLEGGPRLAGAFLGQSAVDRLVMFQAPVVLGAGAVPAFAFAPSMSLSTARRLAVLEQRPVGDDLMTVYAISDP